MKNNGSIIWGIILVIVGLILGGNALGLTEINLFFDGWWTVFIIVPSFIGLFKDNDKTGSFLGLLVGILLLLACRGMLDYELIWKLTFPAIITAIGLSLIIKNLFNRNVTNNIKKIEEKGKVYDKYTATFSGQNIKIDGEVFKGTNLDAVFGGLKLDLRNAIIEEDVVINASSVFGGIDIFVPNNIIVKTKSNSIFGGVSNKKDKLEKNETTHTIYLNATCVFGGVDIK